MFGMQEREPTLADQTFYSCEDVAKAVGFFYRRGARKGELNVQMARRWLKRADAAVKYGRWWYTTKAMLRQAFPKAGEDWISRLPD